MDNIKTYNGCEFTWHEGVGCTEASTFGPVVEQFKVVSHRTGNTMTFTRQNTVVDRNHDVVCYTYAAAKPLHGGYVYINVYND